MGLFKRFNDVIAANINDIVDRMEDPEKGLKQAIREMEESVQSATSETAKVIANQKRLEKELARNEADVTFWSSRAQEFVDSSDDDGARDALTKATDAGCLAGAAREQLDAATGASKILREQLTGMQAKLEEARRSLATLSARKKAADIRKQAIDATRHASDVVVEKSAFDKFDRLREKVETAEAEAEALAELTGHMSRKSSGQSGESEVEKQLAALKASRPQG